MRNFGKFTQTTGDYEIVGDGNVIFWTGDSEQFAETINELIADRQLYLHPVEPLIYLIDGATLSLPNVKRVPADGYKDPHWQPVALRLSA